MAVSAEQVEITYPLQLDEPDAAAVQAYEELLLGASQLTLRKKGLLRDATAPAVAVLTIDVGSSRDALELVVHIDPESKDTKSAPVQAKISLKNVGPYFAHRTELKLPDGRVVFRLTSTGQKTTEKPPQSQTMDGVSVREDLVPVGFGACCDQIKDPIKGFPSITLTQGADAKEGYQLSAPSELNGSYALYGKAMCAATLLTCGAGAVCCTCCVAPPAVQYTLASADGATVEGVRYQKKGGKFCDEVNAQGIPLRDTIEFPSDAPVQVRKAMMTIAAHKVAMIASKMEDAGF
jgi:hypothetical protein